MGFYFGFRSMATYNHFKLSVIIDDNLCQPIVIMIIYDSKEYFGLFVLLIIKLKI